MRAETPPQPDCAAIRALPATRATVRGNRAGVHSNPSHLEGLPPQSPCIDACRDSPSPGLRCNPTSPRKRGEVKWDSCADSTQPHHALEVAITSTRCLLKQRPALDVEPRPSGAAVVVGGIGLDNVGENFRGFDQPRSGPVEIMMSVRDKDPAVLHGLEGMPSRLR